MMLWLFAVDTIGGGKQEDQVIGNRTANHARPKNQKIAGRNTHLLLYFSSQHNCHLFMRMGMAFAHRTSLKNQMGNHQLLACKARGQDLRRHLERLMMPSNCATTCAGRILAACKKSAIVLPICILPGWPFIMTVIMAEVGQEYREALP
jgi:hypothetical protein